MAQHSRSSSRSSRESGSEGDEAIPSPTVRTGGATRRHSWNRSSTAEVLEGPALLSSNIGATQFTGLGVNIQPVPSSSATLAPLQLGEDSQTSAVSSSVSLSSSSPTRFGPRSNSNSLVTGQSPSSAAHPPLEPYDIVDHYTSSPQPSIAASESFVPIMMPESTFHQIHVGPSQVSFTDEAESISSGETSDEGDRTHLTSSPHIKRLSQSTSPQRIVNYNYSFSNSSNDPATEPLSPNTSRSTGGMLHPSLLSPNRQAMQRSPSTTIRRIGNTIRRASNRVVNMAGGEDNQAVRLEDEDDDGSSRVGTVITEDPIPIGPEESIRSTLVDEETGLRGRTLGFIGPKSWIRKTCWKAVKFKGTEPIILLLIIINVVVVTIQGSASLVDCQSGGACRPDSYFKQWEDYVVFVLFLLFTVEMFARIIVSGLILPPEIRTSALFFGKVEGQEGRTSFRSKIMRLRQRVSSATALTHPQHQRTRSNSMDSNASDDLFTIAPLEHDLNDSHPGDDSRPHAQDTFKAPRKLDLKSQLSRVKTLGKRRDTDPSSPGSHKMRKASSALEKTFSSLPAEELSVEIESGSPSKPPVPKTKTTLLSESPFQHAVAHQRALGTQFRPYLRHSWHRIDMLAILCYWVMFWLAVTGYETSNTLHLYIFRALSVLRASRLLVVTSGTTTILHSLKRAGPLLGNVAFFVTFAMVLFSIIGIQSFKGSYRRTCQWIDPENSTNIIDLGQSCGSWYNGTASVGAVDASMNVLAAPKGYICPYGQYCLSGEVNVQAGQSFDNILESAMQVVVVASVNTWSQVMYNMMDSDYFLSCFYFIVAVIILNFWLINLLVAVVVNTFADIRSETKQSAFGASKADAVIHSSVEQFDLFGTVAEMKKKQSRREKLKILYDRTERLWAGLAVASLATQATKTAATSSQKLKLLNRLELGYSLGFDLDILLRIVTHWDEWRSFFTVGRNIFDLVIAVVSTIIQIPVIADSTAHSWLTVFQLLRWYRVILVVPRMRPLLAAVFGSVAGLANQTLFLFMINFLAALVGLQLWQGDIAQDGTTITFYQIYNSFLGMYQLFSSENWTTVLYSALGAELSYGQGIITAVYLCGWFLLSNFILLQMFIAVIHENFAIAEDQKRQQQMDAFIRKSEPKSAANLWVEKWNPYRYFKGYNSMISRDTGDSSDEPGIPLKTAETTKPFKPSWLDERSYFEKTGDEGMGSYLRRVLRLDANRPETFALQNLKSSRISLNILGFRDPASQHQRGSSNRRSLFLSNAVAPPSNPAQAKADREAREREQAFIRVHPSYDRSLWIFRQNNLLRRFCQKLVPSPAGERVFGIPANPTYSFFFKLVIYISVISSVVVAGVATPSYRKTFYDEHGVHVVNWFEMTEISLGFIFVVEFLIKIIADGFPNAYLRNIFNLLDLIVLITLLVNTITTLVFVGGLSRFTRALKAFRTIRLITLSERLRETFHSVIISGFVKILDAAMLVILYMIPFSVWGLNIFRGLLFYCNDDNSSGLVDCNNEYLSSPTDVGSFLAPRVWSNPGLTQSVWSFDDFKSSLLILFEVVSLEGWIDVMASTMNINGIDLQPSTNASQWNALFSVIYNLFGAVIILTLFVSIIIENFGQRSGSALLTTAQRQWEDLEKVIARQAPSKRPRQLPGSAFRSWCYERSVSKHGYWSRGMFALYILHIILLTTQTYANSVLNSHSERLRDIIFVVFLSIFAFDISIRGYGLGWRAFRSNGWNIYDLLAISGSVTTTLLTLTGSNSNTNTQLQKLFLVSISLKLVQKSSPLNQLFKTAVTSLPAIGNLFMLWFCFFLFFGLMDLEVFSLAKWGNSETRYQNFRDFPQTLVMLAFMSTGEGWNGYMHDYTMSYPRCTESNNYLESDCGSMPWALSLFIAFNIISMYLFVNMFTGVVVQSFSYVFQFPGKASLNREDIRAFKKVWAEFDSDRTGYIKHDAFIPFFAKLSGVFEVRPYAKEYSVKNIIRLSAPSGQELVSQDPLIISGTNNDLNVHKLNTLLHKIDFSKIRKRRKIFNRLVIEAAISDEGGKGISFTKMLTMLAHYKLVDDEEALQIEDLQKRRNKTDLVQELVNLDKAQCVLRTLVYRRRFLQLRKEMLRTLIVPTHGMPAIVVDGSNTVPATPPRPTLNLDTSSIHSTPSQSSPRNYSPTSAATLITNPFGDDITPSSPRVPNTSLSPSDLQGRSAARDSI